MIRASRCAVPGRNGNCRSVVMTDARVRTGLLRLVDYRGVRSCTGRSWTARKRALPEAPL